MKQINLPVPSAFVGPSYVAVVMPDYPQILDRMAESDQNKLNRYEEVLIRLRDEMRSMRLGTTSSFVILITSRVIEFINEALKE